MGTPGNLLVAFGKRGLVPSCSPCPNVSKADRELKIVIVVIKKAVIQIDIFLMSTIRNSAMRKNGFKFDILFDNAFFSSLCTMVNKD